MPIKADKSLRAYYNEINPFAAQWMRNLMAEGWITKGDVDERSIEDVQPNDLTGYDRLHFFAGVAVWDYALNQAGWGRGEIWTGSCPCQPFSQAGEGSGFDDERHLWPHFHWLIQERRPAAILGEQVASKDAEPWINLVHADLEGLGYAFGAVPFPSASVGAPHIRDRLFWVANSADQRRIGRRSGGASDGRDATRVELERLCDVDGLAHNDSHGRSAQPIAEVHHAQRDAEPCGSAGRLGDAYLSGPQGGKRGRQLSDAQLTPFERAGEVGGAGPVNGFWRDADWLLCRDGKFRPVEPGTFPLAARSASGMGRLRANWYAPAGKEGQGHRAERLKGYGNAINASAAEVFIRCVMEPA